MMPASGLAYASDPMSMPAGTFDLSTCIDSALSYAFQPIVHATRRTTMAFEALLRGPGNDDANSIFKGVPAHQLIPFDQQCRVDAMRLARRLGIACELNLNVDPRSFEGAGESMMAAMASSARECGLKLNQIVLEMTEGDMLHDRPAFRRLMNRYRQLGMKVAIDDFGAGYSGLNLLADFQPDQIKLDRHLVAGIEGDGPRQAIVRALIQICADLGIELVAEGIETYGTYAWFRREGVELFQGYLFARPGLETLPVATIPVLV